MRFEDLKVLNFSKVFLNKCNINTIGEDDFIHYLINLIEGANRDMMDDIEDDLVIIGSSVVKRLVTVLGSQDKKLRNLAAMVLIRIGEPAIDLLVEEYSHDEEKQWIVEFLISQISGSSISLVGIESLKSTMVSVS